MRAPARTLLCLCLLALAPFPGRAADKASGDVPSLGYTVVKVRPHDRGAFTEGLIYWNGALLESTGLYGQSTLRKVDLETGAVKREVRMPERYFGEGIAVLGGKVYQLTWKSQKGFIYDLDTLKLVGGFSYSGEGWGMTTDGKSLIMTDGTNRIRFIDPDTFKVTKTIGVFAFGRPINQLNSLAWVKGVLYANVWQTQFILQIDPADGRVLGDIDFVGILPQSDYAPDTDVMNGIAYDAANDRLFVTGKDWPKLFEVKVAPK